MATEYSLFSLFSPLSFLIVAPNETMTRSVEYKKRTNKNLKKVKKGRFCYSFRLYWANHNCYFMCLGKEKKKNRHNSISFFNFVGRRTGQTAKRKVVREKRKHLSYARLCLANRKVMRSKGRHQAIPDSHTRRFLHGWTSTCPWTIGEEVKGSTVVINRFGTCWEDDTPSPETKCFLFCKFFWCCPWKKMELIVYYVNSIHFIIFFVFSAEHPLLDAGFTSLSLSRSLSFCLSVFFCAHTAPQYDWSLLTSHRILITKLFLVGR